MHDLKYFYSRLCYKGSYANNKIFGSTGIVYLLLIYNHSQAYGDILSISPTSEKLLIG